MNMKATGSEQYEEHGIKPPKVRNLLPSKKFRDNVRKWGESSEMSRRRVIIVPSIKCAAREVNVTAEDKGKDMDDTGYLVSYAHKCIISLKKLLKTLSVHVHADVLLFEKVQGRQLNFLRTR